MQALQYTFAACRYPVYIESDAYANNLKTKLACGSVLVVLQMEVRHSCTSNADLHLSSPSKAMPRNWVRPARSMHQGAATQMWQDTARGGLLGASHRCSPWGELWSALVPGLLSGGRQRAAGVARMNSCALLYSRGSCNTLIYTAVPLWDAHGRCCSKGRTHALTCAHTEVCVCVYVLQRSHMDSFCYQVSS